MNQITEQSRKKLISSIFDTIMSDPDKGMGDMGDVMDAAENIVNDWIEAQNITVTE